MTPDIPTAPMALTEDALDAVTGGKANETQTGDPIDGSGV